jgi:hypothetical protein
VLATANVSNRLTPARAAVLDDLAARTALVAVFGSDPALMQHRFRSVAVGENEPLAMERSTVVVAPMSSAALIAVECGVAPDGTTLFDYRLTYDRDAVLDAATVLLRRIPARTTP